MPDKASPPIRRPSRSAPLPGLRCRACGSCCFKVLNTRPTPAGHIWRRRECQNCGKRATTIERFSGH